MPERRWKIWKREGSCGVDGPSTAIDFNRAEKVEVVAADSFDALLSALQGEVERLRKIDRDCAEAARELRDPVRVDKALIQSDEAEVTADRLQKILDTYGGGER